jgi:aspartate/methionine/tyrosine aminotransferase
VSGSGLDGTGFARRLLVDHHVAVTPGAAFGIRGERFVRISLATEPDQLIEGVERLVEMSGGAV